MDMNVSGDVQVLKKRQRARMSAVRAMLGPDGRAKADAKIAAKATAHPAYEQADTVFTYLSVGDEVDTRAIAEDAWAKGKTVAVPRCVEGGNRMEWFRIESFEGLETSSHGIEEPPRDEASRVEVPAPGSGAHAVAFVPGFSFDAQGNRLGYGGGYYDAFLPTFGGTSVGLCRTAQKTAEIPLEEHDVPVDICIFD